MAREMRRLGEFLQSPYLKSISRKATGALSDLLAPKE